MIIITRSSLARPTSRTLDPRRARRRDFGSVPALARDIIRTDHLIVAGWGGLSAMADRELPSVVQSQYEPMTATTYGAVNSEFLYEILATAP